MKTCLLLFWSFVKIGFTSFGGLSMIPLINSEMISHGWMTPDEVSDIVAIAEMTPGSLGINCATFAGMKTAGVFGAMAANFGVITPSLTVCVFIAILFNKFKDNRVMKKALVGVRPACLGFVVAAVIGMLATNYTIDGKISPICIAMGVVEFFLIKKFKLDVPLVILISAAAGVVAFGGLAG